METKKVTYRPSPTALLNPRLDWNFKAMFTQETEGSQIALKSFLSSVLGRAIKEAAVAANEPPVDAPSQMQMSFDVSVKFDDGEKASIEMQGQARKYDYAVRSEIHAARLLNNNAKKGSKWRANKVYQISVLNFHYKKGDKSEMSWYTMKDRNGNGLADRLNVIFIDLLTIKKLVGTPVEKLTPLQKWGLYLSYVDDESKVDYVDKIADSEGGIMEAKAVIERMSEEESNWFREFSRDTAMRDYNSDMEAATEEGAKKNAVENARNLYANGVSLEIIAKSLRMTQEEVEEIVKDIAITA
ncbi:MAG: Rpn family recombination-promoting nuclease/putative transposase [Treponema sp.]|nr:Rpn family recombination-promoting nuclease/putative transposase [Treponema sp.]